MKNLVGAVILLVAVALPAFAGMKTKTVDTSTSNLPATYNTSASSLLVSGNRGSNLMITNETGSRVYCTATNISTVVAPSSANSKELVIPATSIKAWDKIGTGPTVYCRSGTGSTISSGVLTVEVW